MALTEEGVDETDIIMALIYSYLNLIKDKGVLESIFEDNSRLCKMKFIFGEKSDRSTFVQSATRNMRKYPPLHYLCVPVLLREYDPDVVRKLLGFFTPENSLMAVVAKSAAQ